MEALLGLLLGAALISLAAFAAARAAAVGRERRLRDELEVLRRSVRPQAMPGPLSMAAPALDAPRTREPSAVAPRPGAPPSGSFPAATLPSPSPAGAGAGAEASPASAAPPAPAAIAGSPGAAGAAASAASAARTAATLVSLAALEELARRLRDLEAALALLPEPAAAAPADAEESLPSATEPVPGAAPGAGEDETLSLLEAQQALEGIADEASRLADRLRSADESAERLFDSSRGARSLLALVEARAVASAPLAGELSGLADRMNLLALSLALLEPQAGGEAEPFNASVEELRGLFESARRLSRELATHGQQVADAALRAGEAAAEISRAAVEQQSKETRGAERLARVRELTGRLGASLERARAAAAGREERLRRAGAAAEALARHLAAGKRRREEERLAAAAQAERLAGVRRAAAAARAAADEAAGATESLRQRPPRRPGSA